MERKKAFLLVTLISVFSAITQSQTVYAFPIGPFPQERISNFYNANNGFGIWEDYFISYADSVLTVRSAVELSPINGVTLDQVNDLMVIWEDGIEDIWNDKYFILKDGQHHISIEIDVVFNESILHGGANVYNHEVEVRPGPERSNEHKWDTADTGYVAAHEFGHMLGLFDEYAGGATDPGGEILDATSIMGSTATGAVPYKRHYEDFRAWLAAKDTTQSFELFLIPEPQSTLLVGVGLFILVVAQRRGSPRRESV